MICCKLILLLAAVLPLMAQAPQANLWDTLSDVIKNIGKENSVKMKLFEKNTNEILALVKKIEREQEKCKPVENPNSCTTMAPITTTVRPECEKIMPIAVNLTQLETGVYFFHRRQNTNWFQASKFCADNGMQLVSFETEQEMKLVYNHTLPNMHHWVSATEFGEVPGRFEWSAGGFVDDSFWAANEPNDWGLGRLACGILFPNGKLYDTGCHRAYSYVCEVAARDLPCLE